MTDRSCAGVRQLLIRLLALVMLFATVEALASCLAEWPQMARDHNATAWLTYMPSKQRVLDGRLRFTADALPRIIHWKTGDFPEYLAAQCDRHSIQFVDLMPALVEQTNKSMPTCNPIWDTHLNETGSKVVARMLTDAMCGAADRDKTQ